MRRHIAQHENERANKIYIFFYLAFRFYFSGAHCCFFLAAAQGQVIFGRTVVVVVRIGLARLLLCRRYYHLSFYRRDCGVRYL